MNTAERSEGTKPRAIVRSSLRSDRTEMGTASPSQATSSTYESVKVLCRSLSPDQIRELRDILTLQLEAAERSSYLRDEMMWFDAILGALKPALGGSIGVTYAGMRRTDVYGRFRSSMRVVEGFTKSCGIGRLTTPQKKKWYRLLAEVLVTRCDGLDAPLHFKLVLNQSERLPGLVDKAFPGYVESGLIKKVL